MSNDFEKYNKKTLAGVAKDAEAFAIRDLLAETNRNILCILSDGISLNQVYETLSFLQQTFLLCRHGIPSPMTEYPLTPQFYPNALKRWLNSFWMQGQKNSASC